jgi:cobalt-zinc-cadmium efflux system outer membrane protein
MLQFRANVSRAELSLLQAQTRLQALLGRKPGSNLVDITDDLSVSGQNLPLELGHLEDLSRQHRPDLAAALLTQSRSQADLRLQIAQGKIDYTVGSEYRRQQGLSGTSNSVGLFFSAPLPFYNRNQGEIARAEAERQQITSRITALQFSISSEVKTAYQSFSSSHALVQEIEGNLLKPAQEARDTVGYTYKSGASTLIEFLDAQRAFNDTMQSYYQAKADYLRAIVALTSAVGTEIVP